MVISKTPPTQGLAGVKNLRTPGERPSDGLPQGSSSVSRCLHKRCSRIKSAFASYQATRRHRLCMLVARSRSDGRAALVRGCIGVGFALAASLTYVPLCLHVRNWHTRCRKMIVNKRVLAITGTSSAHGTQQEEHCRGSCINHSRLSAVRQRDGVCHHILYEPVGPSVLRSGRTIRASVECTVCRLHLAVHPSADKSVEPGPIPGR